MDVSNVSIFGHMLNAAQISRLYANRAVLNPGIAPTYALSDEGRSGATRSGYFLPRLIVTIDGTDRTDKIWKYTTSIEKTLDEEPDVATFRTFGFTTPVPGKEVIISFGAVANRLFAGQVLRTTQLSVPKNAETVSEVTCVDYARLANRLLVKKAYAEQSSTDIVTDIVSNFTSGFTVTNVKTGGPTITGGITFAGVPVMDALTQISRRTAASGTRWTVYIDANKDVHFFDTELKQDPSELTATNIAFTDLDYHVDGSQICTRAIVVGVGSKTTAAVSAGSSTIPVEECAHFAASGTNYVTHGGQDIKYTGRSASSGAGNLTGVPTSGDYRILTDLKKGDMVRVQITRNDTSAQSALSTIEGSLSDGIYERKVVDNAASIAQCEARGDAYLDTWKNDALAGGYITRDYFADAGRTQVITLPSRGISVSARIERVRITMQAHHRPVRSCQFNDALRLSLADVIAGTTLEGSTLGD
jgi:hypothetical protein